MDTSKPSLIGEDNPYGGDPHFALWPDPPGSAGDHLARKILGLGKREYLRRFERENLCGGEWTIGEARLSAMRLIRRGLPLILLGSKVCKAFGVDYVPFTHLEMIATFDGSCECFVLPHPSGRSRAWNDPEAVRRTRALLAEFLK